VHLVETNVLSEMVRPRPNANVLRWLAAQDALGISVVSLEELAYGIARAPAPRRPKLAAWFESMLESVDRVYDVTPAVARAAGELRAARDRAGRSVAQADMLIAATAVVHGLTLATRNVADFEGCGLIIADPFAASA
jgi:predicted nucleic acid-binding protein